MGKRRTRPLRRRAPRTEPRLRLLVLCEGKVTEPRYFQAFRHEHRNQLVHIEVMPACGVPKTLVEHAAERKKQALREAKRYGDSFLKYDEVWCVFDVDVHPNLEEAKNQARDNGLRVAISNPCFELWVLLHFQDQRAHQGRAHMQAACRDHLPEFDKEVPYDRIQPRYAEAVARAIELEKWQEEQGRPGGNPSTDVYKLTGRIVGLGREAFLRQQQTLGRTHRSDLRP